MIGRWCVTHHANSLSTNRSRKNNKSMRRFISKPLFWWHYDWIDITMYNKGRKSNSRSKILWLIISIFFFPFGAIFPLPVSLSYYLMILVLWFPFFSFWFLLFYDLIWAYNSYITRWITARTEEKERINTIPTGCAPADAHAHRSLQTRFWTWDGKKRKKILKLKKQVFYWGYEQGMQLTQPLQCFDQYLLFSPHQQ